MSNCALPVQSDYKIKLFKNSLKWSLNQVAKPNIVKQQLVNMTLKLCLNQNMRETNDAQTKMLRW